MTLSFHSLPLTPYQGVSLPQRNMAPLSLRFLGHQDTFIGSPASREETQQQLIRDFLIASKPAKFDAFIEKWIEDQNELTDLEILKTLQPLWQKDFLKNTLSRLALQHQEEQQQKPGWQKFWSSLRLGSPPLWEVFDPILHTPRLEALALEIREKRFPLLLRELMDGYDLEKPLRFEIAKMLLWDILAEERRPSWAWEEFHKLVKQEVWHPEGKGITQALAQLLSNKDTVFREHYPHTPVMNPIILHTLLKRPECKGIHRTLQALKAEPNIPDWAARLLMAINQV